MKALTGTRIFTGARLIEAHAVLIEDGVISAVLPQAEVPKGVTQSDLGYGILAPGFIDVQVNGGGGVLFNDRPTVEGLAAIGAAHRRFGTTGFMPTLITDSDKKMAEAAAAVDEAIEHGVPGVLGIHFEGPYLSPARAGIHDPAAIRSPQEGDLALLTALDRGRTLVTLAPEQAPPGFVASLVAAGVIVAAGHTAASFEQMTAGFAAGITGVTHLFNAMSPLTSREPGAVGAALADPGSWCGLIVDGHHVHPASLRVAIQAKPQGRMILVTDAMSTVGTDITRFTLHGREITVENGRATAADGTLAGSCLDMATAVKNTVRLVGLAVEEALAMASTWPAEFLGLGDRLGRIAPGYAADLVLLDDDLSVRATWIDGEAS